MEIVRTIQLSNWQSKFKIKIFYLKKIFNFISSIGDTIRPFTVYRQTFINEFTNRILTDRATVQFNKNPGTNSNGFEIYIDKLRLTFFGINGNEV